MFLESVRGFIAVEMPKFLREPRYFASFSRDPRNPTMWGHYADAERGFVLVFATNDGTISIRSPASVFHGTRPISGSDRTYKIGIYRDERVEVKPVTYRPRPAKVNAFHRLIPKFHYSEAEYHYDVPENLHSEAATKEEDQIGLVKASNWRYEQEERAFFPTFSFLPPDVRVLQVSFENIKGLIFGPKMSSADRIRAIVSCYLLREYCKENAQQNFVFFQARPQLDRFDFDIFPVGILDDHYYGELTPLKRTRELDSEASARVAETLSQMHRCWSSNKTDACAKVNPRPWESR